MLNHRSLVVVVSLLLLAACSERLPLSLKSTSGAVVYELGSTNQRTISPGTETHRRLALWVASNQEGWEPYLATPPALGVIVRAHEISIQFVGTSAIAHTKRGVFVKKVAPVEYAFLLGQNGA
jgi:hypothetical protein